MATCSSCFKQIPDDVTACPHCGVARQASGEGARTMFGYSPSPEQLRQQIEAQQRQQQHTPQAPPAPQPQAPQAPQAPPQPQAPGASDPSLAQTMYAPSSSVQPQGAPMGAPPMGAPPMGAPPQGVPATVITPGVQGASMGAPPQGAPMGDVPATVHNAGAPPQGAPTGAPPMGAPMGAPMGGPPQGAPMGAPPMGAPPMGAAPQGAPPSATSQAGVGNADRRKSGAGLVLAIIALVMSVASVGTMAYAAIETYPNYRSARRHYILGALRRYRSRYRHSYSSGSYLYYSYRSTLRMQMLFGIWLPALIALVLAIIAVAKKRLLGLVPLGLSVAAVGVSLFFQPSW